MSFVPAISNASTTVGSLVSKLLSPEKLSWVATKLPMKLNCLVIGQVINSVFAEQIAEGDFDFLEDQQLQIEVLDADLFVAISFSENKIQCTHFASHATESDASLSIDTGNAIKLIQQEIDPDTLFFHRKLKISGDTELAHQVKNTIDTIDPEVIPGLLMRLISEYKQRILGDH